VPCAKLWCSAWPAGGWLPLFDHAAMP
jgi:hypothetical protein